MSLKLKMKQFLLSVVVIAATLSTLATTQVLAADEEFVSEQAMVEGFYAGTFIRKESRVNDKAYVYSNPDLKFVAGEKVDMVVTLQNTAKNQEFIVDRIVASTRSTHMWRLVYQNYTGRKYTDSLPAGYEGNYQYSFTPDETLDPREYGLVVTAEFHDLTGRKYIHAVFNSTYEIVDNDSIFDLQTIFMFGVFIGFAFVISQAMQMSSPASAPVEPAGATKKVYKPKKSASSTAIDGDEWLKDTNFKN